MALCLPEEYFYSVYFQKAKEVSRSVRNMTVVMVFSVGLALIFANSWLAMNMPLAGERKAVRNAMGHRLNYKSNKKRLSDMRIFDSAYRIASKKDSLLGNLYQKAALKTKQAGFFNERAGMYYLIFQIGLPLIIGILLILSGRGLVMTVFTSISSGLAPYIMLKGKAVERKKGFQKTSYKIYKYLNSQVASGVTPFNAMKGVYQAVDDKNVAYALAAFVAKYELTQNIDEASKELKQRFDSSEAETLTVAFEQGIKTGDNAEILDLQETIMFDNYVNILQMEHKKSGILAFLAGLSFAAGAVLIMSIPMVYEMLGGFSSFFSN